MCTISSVFLEILAAPRASSFTDALTWLRFSSMSDFRALPEFATE